MKVLIAVPFLLLALLGAGGMSSLVDDDFCGMFPITFPEGSGSGSELKYAPPGVRCIYTAPDGHQATTETGSWSGFLIALAGQLAVAAWYLRRRSPAARVAFASTVALAVTGAFGLYYFWQGGFIAGLFFSVPVGWLVGGRDPAAGLAAGAAVFVTACFTLWYGDGSAPVGCYVAVALVTTASAALRRARPVSSS